MTDRLRPTQIIPFTAHDSSRPRPDWLSRMPAALLATTGGALIVVGSMMPWLTLFAGLQALNGTDGLYGRLLFAGGVAAIVSGVAFLLYGSRLTRRVIGLLGVTLVVFSVWLLAGLLQTWREVAADPLLVGQLGRGLFVAGTGALLVLVSLLAPGGIGVRALLTTATLRPAIATAAISAALVHFAAIGSHLAEHRMAAAFFALVGTLQLTWALLVLLRRPSRPLLLAGITGNLLIIGTWVGTHIATLPVSLHGHNGTHIGMSGVLAVGAEGVAIMLALGVLLHQGQAR